MVLAETSSSRELVPVKNVIVAIDLATRWQMVVVTHRGSKVMARRTLRCEPGTLRSSSLTIGSLPLTEAAPDLMADATRIVTCGT